MHTKTLQSKIDQLSAAGGGTLTLPPGEHLCGTLFLKSGIHLNLAEGCILRASLEESDYPILGSTVNETGVMRALIFAEGQSDISISGPGRIESSGTEALRFSDSEATPFRPETILLRDCARIRLENFSIHNSSFWTVHLLRCEDVDIHHLTIRNRRDRINTDGIDPDGCKRVRIHHCDIDCGDDGIVLKSTEGDDCEDIDIRDCSIRTSCAGLKIGTETLGNIRNVSIQNCQLHDCEMGFGIFLKDGGRIENIRVSDLDLTGEGEFMIFLDHSPRYYDQSPWGILRNITLEQLRVHSPGRLFINGPLSDLTLKNIDWTVTGPMEFGKMGKPAGSVRSRPDPTRSHPERLNAQLVLSEVTELTTENIQFYNLPPGREEMRVIESETAEV